MQTAIERVIKDRKNHARHVKTKLKQLQVCNIV